MNDATTPFTLRSPEPDKVTEFIGPLGIAFGEHLGPEELELEAKLLEPDRLVGAFDGDTQVSCAGAFTFRVTVPGGAEVGAAGITIVGVLPSHTRRGILRQMMTWLIAQARERGEPLAVLGASEAAIYQRFGYGIGTLQTQFDIDPARAIFREPVEMPGPVRFVDADEAARVFPAVYDAVRAVTPGCLSRSEDKWRWNMVHDAEWMRGGNGAKYLALLEVDGQPKAYAIYRIKADWDSRGPKNTLSALEVVGADPVSEQAMWQWIFRIDLLASVKAYRGPVPHPLTLQLTEPKRLGVVVKDETWLRILDVDKALEARSYLGSGSLTFDLTDSFCPWNAGRWQLTVPGGGAAATVRAASKSAKADIALDVSALSTAYLGTHTFAALARAGRVTELRVGGIAAADGLFLTGVAPWSSTPF